MKYLTIFQVLEIYKNIVHRFGGAFGLRNAPGLQSALAQPEMTFEGNELYPSLHEKASVLAYSIVNNHPFIDGNKRIAHAVMEVFLIMNGYELNADIDEQEEIFLKLARGEMQQRELSEWINKKINKLKP